MAYHMDSPFGDTTYTKVFVGGLAWETQSDTLRRHFEPYGEILEAVVISDKLTGRSKGYGFVTFSDPESAKKACEEPNPVIDGRRANCNLASLGRPQPYIPYGPIRPPRPYFGMPQMPRGNYIASPSYQQPGPASYQPGLSYPSYGYTPYGPEFVYPQGVYNPYISQYYIPMYGQSGPVNTNMGPYGQLGPPHRGPNIYLPQYGGPSASVLTTDTTAPTQIPYGTGQPRIVVPGQPPQFPWNRSSNQTG